MLRFVHAIAWLAMSTLACQTLLDFDQKVVVVAGDAAAANDGSTSGADAAPDGLSPPDALSRPDAVGSGCNDARFDFCDDFEATPVGERWTNDYADQGGEYSFAIGGANGSAGALLVEVPASTALEPTAQLLLRRGETPKSFKVSFQVFIEAMTTTAEQLITVIPLKTSAGEVNATLGVNGTHFIFRFDGLALLGPAKLGTWTLIEQAIDVATGTIEIKIDGAVVHQGVLGTLTPTEATIDFGLYRGGPSDMQPTRFRLDDFVLDLVVQ